MTTFKVKFRPSAVAGKAGSVHYQVIHRREVRQISAGIQLQPKEWNRKRAAVRTSADNAKALQRRIDSGLSRLQQVVGELEEIRQYTGRHFTAQDIADRFKAPEQHTSVVGYALRQIKILTECAQLGTAGNYRKGLKSLMKFSDNKDLDFEEITPQLVKHYNEYLVQKGVSRNSRSFYLRVLRAIYNKAVREGMARQTFPFQDVYTGIDYTGKRAVSEKVIAALVRLDLSRSRPQALARDLFLFSLYTRGMAFVDMAYLKKSNVRGNAIHYVRHKTGQHLAVKIEPCIRRIIDRHAKGSRGYMFPILKSDEPRAAYRQYQTALGYYNRQLKHISRKLMLERNISFYTARHSWATMARNHDVPLPVISAGMGHRSERTTQIYLALLENSVIDNANKRLLKALKNAASL